MTCRRRTASGTAVRGPNRGNYQKTITGERRDTCETRGNQFWREGESRLFSHLSDSTEYDPAGREQTGYLGPCAFPVLYDWNFRSSVIYTCELTSSVKLAIINCWVGGKSTFFAVSPSDSSEYDPTGGEKNGYRVPCAFHTTVIFGRLWFTPVTWNRFDLRTSMPGKSFRKFESNRKPSENIRQSLESLTLIVIGTRIPALISGKRFTEKSLIF